MQFLLSSFDSMDRLDQSRTKGIVGSRSKKDDEEIKKERLNEAIQEGAERNQIEPKPKKNKHKNFENEKTHAILFQGCCAW